MPNDEEYIPPSKKCKIDSTENSQSPSEAVHNLIEGSPVNLYEEMNYHARFEKGFLSIRLTYQGTNHSRQLEVAIVVWIRGLTPTDAARYITIRLHFHGRIQNP